MSYLQSSNQRYKTVTACLISKILFPSEHHLLGKICILMSQRPLRYPSTVYNALKFATEMNIALKPQKIYTTCEPLWKLKNSVFLHNLITLPKHSTPNQIYITLFNEICDTYRNQNWKFLFSKTQRSTSFAIINNSLETEFLATMDNNCSFFTATAIFHTINT